MIKRGAGRRRFRQAGKAVVAAERFAGSKGGVVGRRRASREADLCAYAGAAVEQEQQEQQQKVPGGKLTPFEIVGQRVLAACRAGDVDALHALVCSTPTAANFSDAHGNTPVYLAASLGKAVLLKALVDLGADINGRAPDGMTALTRACWAGEEDAVRLLARAGAQMSYPAVVRGEELPPVAMCPDARMVAVLEGIDHSSVQPLLIAAQEHGRKGAFKHAATVVLAAERFKRMGGIRLSRIEEDAPSPSSSCLSLDLIDPPGPTKTLREEGVPPSKPPTGVRGRRGRAFGACCGGPV